MWGIFLTHSVDLFWESQQKCMEYLHRIAINFVSLTLPCTTFTILGCMTTPLSRLPPPPIPEDDTEQSSLIVDFFGKNNNILLQPLLIQRPNTNYRRTSSSCRKRI